MNSLRAENIDKNLGHIQKPNKDVATRMTLNIIIMAVAALNFVSIPLQNFLK